MFISGMSGNLQKGAGARRDATFMLCGRRFADLPAGAKKRRLGRKSLLVAKFQG
jgi:hypothetical protein